VTADRADRHARIVRGTIREFPVTFRIRIHATFRFVMFRVLRSGPSKRCKIPESESFERG
jgi:hypothetical protein